MSRHLSIVIPNLLPTCQDLAQHPIFKLQLPKLTRLLVCAESSCIAISNYYEYLWQLFKVNSESVPIAAITALADGLTAEQDIWLRADPMCFKADLAGVYLLGEADLSLEETRQLLLEFNTHFNQEGLRFYSVEPGRWYINFNRASQFNTVLPQNVMGKEISAYLPTGKESVFWHKVLTEAQMLLHQSKVNRARAEQNKVAVNGIWLWGEGRLPARQQTAVKQMWTNDIFGRGLAKLGRVAIHALPQSFAEVLADRPEREHSVLVLKALDEHDMSAAILGVEQHYLQPAYQALQQRQLDRVDLYLGNQKIYHLDQKGPRRWWKWTRELAYYV